MANHPIRENGRVLRVNIINGTHKIKEKIQQYANVWTQYANLSFVFVPDADAEIRVRCDNSGQSWSRVGTDCLATPLSLQTMNLGWLTDTTSDDEFSRVITHEFGHAIGCIHEHQSPAGGIPWDRQAVYEYYMSSQGWSAEQVNINIFNLYSRTITQFSDFDLSSIMLYSVPALLTIDHSYSTPWNTDLSETDKAFISEIYPHEKPDTGRFSTDELKHKPSMSAAQRQVFSMVYPSAPDIVVGLSALDLVPTAQMVVGVTSFVDKMTASTADMHIQTTKGTLLTSGAATWFKAAPGSSDFQIGSVDSRPGGGTLVVTFDRPYIEPPNVVVWLSGFEISSNPNNNNNNNNSRWRVSATAIDVTTRGFTLCFDTGGLPKGATLAAANPTSNVAATNTATASWIAFPKSRAGVAGGSFSTQDVAVGHQTVAAKSSWTGKAPVLSPEIFDGKPPSQVLVALNSLDMAVGGALRVKVGAAAASSSSEAVIGWMVESEGGGGVLYSAGASYVALT